MKKCLKNQDCNSFFCDAGYCRSTPGLGDTCYPGMCDEAYECEPTMRRCLFPNFKPAATCGGSLDCHWDQYCSSGKCLNKKPPGSTCIFDQECEDGSECQSGRCMLRCFSDADCNFGEKCIQRAYGFDSPYKLCKKEEPKEEEVNIPAVDVPKPNPVYGQSPEVLTPENPGQQRHGTKSKSAFWMVGLIGIIFIVVVICIYFGRKKRRPSPPPPMVNVAPFMPPPSPHYSPYAQYPPPTVPPSYSAPSPAYYGTPTEQVPSYPTVVPTYSQEKSPFGTIQN